LLGCDASDSRKTHATNVDLLAELEQASVQLTQEHLLGPPGEALEPNLVFVDDMNADADSAWWTAKASSDDSAGLRREQLPSGESVLVVAPSQPPVCTLIAATAANHYRVRVRWRASAEPDEAEPGALLLSGLVAVPQDLTDLKKVQEFVAHYRQRDTKQSPTKLPLRGTRKSTWQESEALLGRDNGRRSLLLQLEGGESGIEVDRIEVRRLTTLEKFVQIMPPEPSRSPLYRRLRLPSQNCECLLLPTGSRVQYALTVPAANPRFDSETRVFGGVRGEVNFRIKINGEEVASRTAYNDANQEGDPWVAALQSFAGKSVALELSLEGPEGYVGLLTAPRLLGSGDPRPSLLLISLDTLRADYLGCYGQNLPLSPTIDQLAAEGTLYERVYSPASYTLPTHATLLTGQHPLVHGVHRRQHRLNPDRSQLLAVRLQTDGYCTAAFTGGGYVDPEFGFAQGFEQYSSNDPAVTEHRLADERKGVAGEMSYTERLGMHRVLEWIERHSDQPYFLFVHTYLVHGYFPQRDYLDRIGADESLDPAKLSLTRLWRLAEEGDEEAVATLRILYAATVAQADEKVVKPLLQALERQNSNVLVALVSDHGEQFLEHDQFGHGGNLWDELVRVPWILRGSGVEAGRRWQTPVALEDVAPTLLELLGLPLHSAVTGIPRLNPQRSGTAEGLVLYLETGNRTHWEGLVTDQWKLLHHSQEKPAWYLFDVAADPAESQDQSAVLVEELKTLKSRLLSRGQKLRNLGPEERKGQGQILSEAVQQQLKALGYTDE
jgi:arylsulfatase A-like enzyme